MEKNMPLKWLSSWLCELGQRGGRVSSKFNTVTKSVATLTTASENLSEIRTTKSRKCSRSILLPRLGKPGLAGGPFAGIKPHRCPRKNSRKLFPWTKWIKASGGMWGSVNIVSTGGDLWRTALSRGVISPGGGLWGRRGSDGACGSGRMQDAASSATVLSLTRGRGLCWAGVQRESEFILLLAPRAAWGGSLGPLQRLQNISGYCKAWWALLRLLLRKMAGNSDWCPSMVKRRGKVGSLSGSVSSFHTDRWKC